MIEELYVSKVNGKLIFRDLGGYETRNPSTIWMIQKADEKYNWKDFKEIKIDTSDNYNGDGCSYIKDNFNKLVPDFVFHSWPQVGINDYEEFVKEIDTNGLTHYEIHKVGWIGNSQTNSMRTKLLELGNQNKDLFDFFDMRWNHSGNVFLNSTHYIYTPDLVKKYSMLIDIEGFGSYSARLKTLFWSHRPLLLVNRPGNEFFFEYLKEWVHYIPVKRDLSDLVEKTKWCMENYGKALIIAENAYQFSRIHLTRDACFAKWNEIILSLENNP